LWLRISGQVHQSFDALFGLWVRAQQRWLWYMATGHHYAFQPATLQTFKQV
jgi:hypothetical protein